MSNQGRIFSINDFVEEKISLSLMACVVISMPLKPAVNWILSIVWFLFWIFFQKKDLSFQSTRCRTSLMLATFALLSIIGLLYTQNINDGLFRIQNSSMLFLYPLIFGTVKTDIKKTIRIVTETFIATFFVTCLVCVGVAFYKFSKDGSAHHFSGHPLVQWMTYPYIFSLSCMVATIFLYEKLRHNTSDSQPLLRTPKVVVLLAVFFSAFIFLVSIKQVIISWVVVTMLYAYVLTKSKRFFFGLVVLIFAMALCAVLFVPALNKKVKEVVNTSENTIPLDTDGSLGRTWDGIAVRKAIWACALDAIAQNPWLGVGTGDSQDKLQEAYEARQFYFASRYNTYNAHNQYLQLLLDFGIVGLILFLSAHFIIPLYRLRASLVFITFSLCVLLMFFTESMLELNKGILLYSFFSSFLIFSAFDEEGKVRLNPF
jgi:O-antigen ligase